MAHRDIRYYLNSLSHGGRKGADWLPPTATASPTRPQADSGFPRQEVIVPRKTVLKLTKSLRTTTRSQDRGSRPEAAFSFARSSGFETD
jgi:hypothetical protein